MKTFLLALACAAAISVHGQLPTASAKSAGFDAKRLEVMHGTVRRFVDEGKHAGIITLVAHDG